MGQAHCRPVGAYVAIAIETRGSRPWLLTVGPLGLKADYVIVMSQIPDLAVFLGAIPPRGASIAAVRPCGLGKRI